MTRLKRDAEYLQTKLGKIDGFGDLGQRLVELVKQKKIATESKDATDSSGKSSPDSNGSKKQS